MQKILFVFVALFSLGGCAGFAGTALDKVTDKGADFLDAYGKEPYDIRQLIRTRINAKAELCEVRVICQGDPESWNDAE